jgi:hypothetical protein
VHWQIVFGTAVSLAITVRPQYWQVQMGLACGGGVLLQKVIIRRRPGI